MSCCVSLCFCKVLDKQYQTKTLGRASFHSQTSLPILDSTYCKFGGCALFFVWVYLFIFYLHIKAVHLLLNHLVIVATPRISLVQFGMTFSLW